MKLIVGLGNPGRSYAKHRHNVGFMVVDYLAKAHDVVLSKNMFQAKVGQGKLGAENLMLVKPQTYMNRSGYAVVSLLGYYKCALADLIVVHDDIDLELGRIKFSLGAGHGGHNGIRSIVEEMDSPQFIRVRLGVGRPQGNMDPADYVLHKFENEEKEQVETMIKKASSAVEDLIKNSLEFVQQKYH